MRAHSNRMPLLLAAGAFLAVSLLAVRPAQAESAGSSKVSPVGTWQTVDDSTKRPKSHVKIWEKNGTIFGRITKLIDPDEPNPLCDRCKGKKQNQPIIGMVILWGLTKADNGWYEGGHIMDPENGKTYRCKVRVVGGGSKLEVRGFVGVSLFGRTQTWNRLP